MEPSKYQLGILDWIKLGKGNAVCNAVAGAGKSTTLRLAALLQGSRVFILAR